MMGNATQKVLVEIEDQEILKFFYDETVGLEIDADISAKFVRDSYGVEHMVHEFESIDDIDVDYPISINGVDFTEDELRAKVGDDIKNKIEELLIESAESSDKWDMFEEEPYDYED